VTAPRRGGAGSSPGASGGARAAIVVGLAVILGIVGLQILDDSGGGSSDATVTTAPGVTTTGTAGTATTTTTPVRDNKDVRVKVYNASGVPGRAQTLTTTLGEKHYDMQDPANLTDKRQGIVVECVKGFEREGQLLASQGVGGGATAQAYPSNPPDGASDADCLVVIGTA
jgi:hypothetical protein